MLQVVANFRNHVIKYKNEISPKNYLLQHLIYLVQLHQCSIAPYAYELVNAKHIPANRPQSGCTVVVWMCQFKKNYFCVCCTFYAISKTCRTHCITNSFVGLLFNSLLHLNVHQYPFDKYYMDSPRRFFVGFKVVSNFQKTNF